MQKKRRRRVLGEKKTKDYRASFSAKYFPGELKAVAVYENEFREFCLNSGGGNVSVQAEVIYKAFRIWLGKNKDIGFIYF